MSNESRRDAALSPRDIEPHLWACADRTDRKVCRFFGATDWGNRELLTGEILKNLIEIVPR